MTTTAQPISLEHKWRTLLILALAELLGMAVWFSASAVSELAKKSYIGTALTLQTSLGFLLTLFTIRLVPAMVTAVTWRYGFMILAVGPAVGIVAMWLLRRSERAKLMANGNR